MSTDDFYNRMYAKLDRLDQLKKSREAERERIVSDLKKVELYLIDHHLNGRRKQRMASAKYTSINILETQHT
ncbi:MAG: hypothetical protein JRI41_10570 [Deltaproteobacteria bacterium]|nr:hypothetical protein [Deltaproteobacteria bacterium]